MPNPFILKLQHGAELTDDDRAALEQAIMDVREFAPWDDVIQEGERPDHVHVVLEGFAFRYKLLPDGTRQIIAYLIPGDMCDLHVSILGEMDHSIGAATRCKIAQISRATVEELTERRPRINRALWWATLVDEGTLREWLVSMGRREADARIAHFLCELLVRLQAVGLATENSYELPITQEQLGDTFGVSTVHVNRTLQALRSEGLISLKGKNLRIEDVERLKDFATFDPNYLHLNNKRPPAARSPANRASEKIAR